MMLQDRQRGHLRISVHIPVQDPPGSLPRHFWPGLPSPLAGCARVSTALLLPQLQAEMLFLRKERGRKHPPRPCGDTTSQTRLP